MRLTPTATRSDLTSLSSLLRGRRREHHWRLPEDEERWKAYHSDEAGCTEHQSLHVLFAAFVMARQLVRISHEERPNSQAEQSAASVGHSANCRCEGAFRLSEPQRGDLGKTVLEERVHHRCDELKYHQNVEIVRQDE